MKLLKGKKIGKKWYIEGRDGRGEGV